MTDRDQRIADAWVRLVPEDAKNRIRPYILRAAIGGETRLERLLSMFRVTKTGSLTSDEIKLANAGGIIPLLRDAGAKIETYRVGRAFIYVLMRGVDKRAIKARDRKKTKRSGVFADRYQPKPGTDLLDEIANDAD